MGAGSPPVLPQHSLLRVLLLPPLLRSLQDGGEDEAEVVEVEDDVAALAEVGMRKSARTEHVDFKAREEERCERGTVGAGVGLLPSLPAVEMLLCPHQQPLLCSSHFFARQHTCRC